MASDYPPNGLSAGVGHKAVGVVGTSESHEARWGVRDGGGIVGIPLRRAGATPVVSRPGVMPVVSTLPLSA
jgi:hypothetical protein